MELLTQNGFAGAATASARQSFSEATQGLPLPQTHHEGYLAKRGQTNPDWKRRWCVYDMGTLSYYKSDVDREPAGSIALETIRTVREAPEESAKDPQYRFCFEVETVNQRTFMFCDDTPGGREEWIRVLQTNLDALPPDARAGFDFGGCEKIGFLKKRGETNTAWRKRFFALKGKELHYFKSEEDLTELGCIDLRNILEILPGQAPPPGTRPPSRFSVEVAPDECEFCVITPQRAYQLRGDTHEQMLDWMAALRNTQVFGASLESNSTVVPIVVDKCVNFIETNGLFSEGVYRVPGNKKALNELKQAFNQNDQAVHISVEKYSVHDAAGLLKLYFRELPDPLLTSRHFKAFLKAAQIADHNNKLYAMQALLGQLPLANFETLKRMCVHLALIAEHEQTNKMGISNLALVFGPTLMTVEGESKDQTSFADMGGEFKCVEALITYHEWLFGMEEKSEKELNVQEGLKKLEEAKRRHGESQRYSTMAEADESTPFIHEIFLENSTNSETMPITQNMTSREVVDTVLAKSGMPYSADLALVECQHDGFERPLEDTEPVLAAVARWREGGDLHLKCVPWRLLLGRGGNADAVISGQLHVKTKKGWKEHFCTLDPTGTSAAKGTLYYYKDEHSTIEAGHVTLQDCHVFLAHNRKHPPTPHCFAIRPLDNDDDIVFFAADTESELERWMASITYALNPSYYASGQAFRPSPAKRPM